jgi:hypothetical protein
MQSACNPRKVPPLAGESASVRDDAIINPLQSSVV